MRCKHIRRLIYERSDRTLTAEQAGEVRAHASSCEACGRALRQWERIRGGFAHVRRAEMPRSVVAEALREPGKPARWSLAFLHRPAFRAGAVAFALATMAGLIFLLPRGGHSPTREIIAIPGGVSIASGAKGTDLADQQLAFIGREHAMFARTGATLDHSLWMAAATEASLELFDEPGDLAGRGR